MPSRRERAIEIAHRIATLREQLADAEAELAALMLERHTRPSIEMPAVVDPGSEPRLRAVGGVGR